MSLDTMIISQSECQWILMMHWWASWESAWFQTFDIMERRWYEECEEYKSYVDWKLVSDAWFREMQREQDFLRLWETTIWRIWYDKISQAWEDEGRDQSVEEFKLSLGRLKRPYWARRFTAEGCVDFKGAWPAIAERAWLKEARHNKSLYTRERVAWNTWLRSLEEREQRERERWCIQICCSCGELYSAARCDCEWMFLDKNDYARLNLEVTPQIALWHK